jgi:hypothetical protein
MFVFISSRLVKGSNRVLLHPLRYRLATVSRLTMPPTQILDKVKVTLRLTVSRSVILGVEPHLGLMTIYLLLFDSYSLVFVGRPLRRENGSVFCICCWSLPAQSFSGPSPLGFVTIFYCLRFETSFSSPPTTRKVTV